MLIPLKYESRKNKYTYNLLVDTYLSYSKYVNKNNVKFKKIFSCYMYSLFYFYCNDLYFINTCQITHKLYVNTAYF